MESTPKVNPPRIQKLPKQSVGLFAKVSPGPVSLFSRGMPINMHSIEEFIASLNTLASRAQNGHVISRLTQGTGFLPHPEIHGNRQVLHNNQDFPGHRDLASLKKLIAVERLIELKRPIEPC